MKGPWRFTIDGTGPHGGARLACEQFLIALEQAGQRVDDAAISFPDDEAVAAPPEPAFDTTDEAVAAPPEPAFDTTDEEEEELDGEEATEEEAAAAANEGGPVP